MAAKQIAPKNVDLANDLINEANGTQPGSAINEQNTAKALEGVNMQTQAPGSETGGEGQHVVGTDLNPGEVSPLLGERSKSSPDNEINEVSPGDDEPLDADLLAQSFATASTENLGKIKEAANAELLKRSEEPAEELDEESRLIKVHGENYITAESGGLKTHFSQHAWNQLPTLAGGAKPGGWKQVVQTPPEVRALNS